MSLKEKALEFATKAHEGQIRKLSKEPYIVHPIQVAKTLEQAGFSEELICAALLHDTVEDTAVTLDQIQKEFGPQIAEYVSSHTEDKTKSWEERKQHTIECVKTAPLEVKALIVADKLDNLRSMIKGQQQIGTEMWACFKRGKDQQKWYVDGIAKNSFIGLDADEIPAFFYDYVKEADGFFQEPKKL